MRTRLIAALALAAVFAGAFVPAVAAPALPMAYTMTNYGRDQIIIAVSGTCGTASRPIKSGLRMAGTCSTADGQASIAALRYPSKAKLCEARITRQGGLDYVTFNGAGVCKMTETLHRLQLDAQVPAIRR